MLKHLDRLKVIAVIVGVVMAMALYKRDFDKKASSKKDKAPEEHWD